MSNLPTCPTPRCVKHTTHYGTRVAEYYLPKKPDTMPDATHICAYTTGNAGTMYARNVVSM
jgi:hypothetical protein